eukprot:m.108518 g.108518  ORF g.108518 m.108518 type:complete len:53 (-) comp15921_c0_seq2:519-677(-)
MADQDQSETTTRRKNIKKQKIKKKVSALKSKPKSLSLKSQNKKNLPLHACMI